MTSSPEGRKAFKFLFYDDAGDPIATICPRNTYDISTSNI